MDIDTARDAQHPYLQFCDIATNSMQLYTVGDGAHLVHAPWVLAGQSTVASWVVANRFVASWVWAHERSHISRNDGSDVHCAQVGPCMHASFETAEACTLLVVANSLANEVFSHGIGQGSEMCAPFHSCCLLLPHIRPNSPRFHEGGLGQRCPTQ